MLLSWKYTRSHFWGYSLHLEITYFDPLDWEVGHFASKNQVHWGVTLLWTPKKHVFSRIFFWWKKRENNYNDLVSYYLYIEIKNYKFSIRNVTKCQHWRHFRNVSFLGGALRHAAHRVQNLVWNKIKNVFLIYVWIFRETREGFEKYCFLKFLQWYYPLTLNERQLPALQHLLKGNISKSGQLWTQPFAPEAVFVRTNQQLEMFCSTKQSTERKSPLELRLQTTWWVKVTTGVQRVNEQILTTKSLIVFTSPFMTEYSTDLSLTLREWKEKAL